MRSLEYSDLRNLHSFTSNCELTNAYKNMIRNAYRNAKIIRSELIVLAAIKEKLNEGS